MALEALRAVARALADSLCPSEVASVIVLHSHDRIGAAMSVVYLHEEGAEDLTLAAARGFAETALIDLQRVPVDRRLPLMDAIREQKSCWYESSDSLCRDYPHLLASTTTTAANLQAVVAIPFCIDGRCLGGMAFSFAHERRFDKLEQEVLLTVADLAAQALERARLLGRERLARVELERANRMKDEFLATISHELRTPLSAILGWAVLLKDRATDEALAKPLDVIHRNAQAQSKIIDDLLDMSRIISENFRIDARAIDLTAIAREAIEVVRPVAIAKSLSIRLDAAESACLIVGDPERLHQVILNLLSNAVKFTDAGGQISVSLQREGATVAVKVTDSGKGIDPPFLPRVFERFQQADSTITRRVGGLGLGLTLVKHIVELHGGEVMAESDGIGQGATFTIRLPIRAVVPRGESRSNLSRAPSAAARRNALAGMRVLVVDDEMDARDLVACVLREAGATVDTARSAAEGFASFTRVRPDVVVSDIGMPEEDGFRFMERIRALPEADGPPVPSLALTAFAGEHDRRRALDAGYTNHLGKPIDPNLLVAAVADACHHRPRR